ncbi:heterokaryon incompatibility protein-domain-containing protein [Bisporella sp. PMI_857]|nr:heterokaryon incompatibility protein-domain-containing protein [Bisporella sp. PMI_857]
MSLCSYCSTIPMNLFSSGRKEQCHHDHQPSYNALEASALSGCSICKFLLQAISAYTGPYAHKPLNQKPSWKEDVPVTLYSTKFNRQTVSFAGREAGTFRGGWIPDGWLEYCTSQSMYSHSEDLLQYEACLIRRWTDVCFNTHTNCGHGSGFLPTRLIDVGAADNMRLSLISTAELHIDDPRYLALSHCWGLAMPDTARTVTATLEKHKTSIQEDELSHTFRDFVGIARRLGIQHVWIDSLCIIQDDAADWEKEASQMASVYSNAYLTIAASSSADGNGGCAVWDSERSRGPADVDCVPVEADFAPTTTNYKFRVWTRDPSPTSIRDDPLQTRGWTLQERELSPRVVNYCKDTIRWECRGLRASLEFPWDDSLSFNGEHRLFDEEQSVFLPMPGVNRPTESPTDPSTKIALAWMNLIVKYTSRRLTKDSDILPAISGVARTIAEATSDEYFAGLWKSYFQHCLLWQSNWNTDHGLQTHIKPLHNTAPSWSWASIRGKVSWPLGDWYSYNPDPDPEFIPKVLDIHIDPLGSDPYGMLKQGILHLGGKVTMAFSLPEADDGAGSPQHRKLQSPITQQEIGWIHYDIPLCSDCAPAGKPNIVFLMCCLNDKKRDNGDMWTYALALQPVLDATEGTPGTMRRVGLASRIKPDFWKYNTMLMHFKIC